MTEGGQVLAAGEPGTGKPRAAVRVVQGAADARQAVRGYSAVEPVGDKGLLLRVNRVASRTRRVPKIRACCRSRTGAASARRPGRGGTERYRAYKELFALPPGAEGDLHSYPDPDA